MKRYDLKEEKGSFVLLELRPVPVATFAERALAELVCEMLEEAIEEPPTGEAMDYFNALKAAPETLHDEAGTLIRHVARNGIVVRKMSDEEVEMMEAGGLLKPVAPRRAEREAEQETETGAAPEGEAPGGEPEAPHGHAAPAEAERVEAVPSAPPACEPPSWEALHARGLTAKQAAEARGAAVSSAYRWAQKAGVEWVSLPDEAPAEPAPRPAADLKGWTQEDLDAALLEVEQGGKVEAVADTFGKPAHVLKSQWMKRLAAKREAEGVPLRRASATEREDAEAGR